MVTRRRGASTLGCLVMLLLVAAGVYFGVNVGEVYWRYYEYQDDIAQQVALELADRLTSEAFFESFDHLGRWLTTVTSYRTIDFVRKEGGRGWESSSGLAGISTS